MKCIGTVLVINEYYSDGPSYCTVEISAEAARQYLGYMDEIRRLRQENDRVYCLHIFDYHPTYYAHSELFETSYNAVTSEEDFHEVDELPNMDCLSEQAIECCRARLTDTSLSWDGFIKHTNISCETGEISRSLLEKIALQG